MKPFIDVDYAQIYKHGQRIGGDVFLLSKNTAGDQIACTLSDGLGSGVKANVLASLTANMAQKLSFGPLNIQHSAEIIMNTLPVCKERRISYSTFTIAELFHTAGQEIEAHLIEYDNPLALLFQGSELVNRNREQFELKRDRAFKEERLYYGKYSLCYENRLILFTDGVSQAGLGTRKYPLGWRVDAVSLFVKELIAKKPDISSRELSLAITHKALQLDGSMARDDITCAVIYVRKPRKLLIVTGPPMDPTHDELLVKTIEEFDGKVIIAGGTTTQIVSRITGKKAKVDMKCWNKEVPPMSSMDGIDLVTEGMLTLNRTAQELEHRTLPNTLPNHAVRKFLELLMDSDQVSFLVGTKINEAHQDPNVPVEIGIRRTIIKRIMTALEQNYLKETLIDYV